MVRRTVVSLAALFALCLPFAMAASGQEELTLAQVRQNVKKARGVEPPVERIVTNFTAHGQSGTDITLRSGSDERTDSTFGPFKDAHGEAGGVSWTQNTNGETIINSGGGNDEDEPTSETRTTMLSRATASSGEYVISELTKLGFGTKEYVDPATWHIVRRERISPTGTRTTIYDDFRTTAGYTRAWHTSSSDGHSENDASTTIASIDTNPIPAKALALPPDARQLVTFPPNVSSVPLPVRFERRAGKFIVRVTIANRGLDFLLDTGSSGIAIDRSVVQQLGLKEYGAYSNPVNAGRYVGTRTIASEIDVGPLVMRDVAMSTIPGIDPFGGDTKIVGLLGFDFIDAVSLKLDYQDGSVTAYDPATFSVAAAPHMIDLDLRLSSYLPQTDIAINGAVGTHWIIDSGGAGAVMITDAFRRRNPDAVVDENHIDHPTQLYGIGGAFDAKALELGSFKLGNVTFKHFGAYVMTDARNYAGLGDGIVGPNLLRLFTVYIDYQQLKMRLIPNGEGSFSIAK